jgi:hypothetical protein
MRTDGGSDNVSQVTHILHWILVWLGCFEEIIWFRFEAGHSHTEVADRLFGVMKRLFQTDSNARVANGARSFRELGQHLEEEFAGENENLLLEYDFANYDFDKFFRGMNDSIEDGLFQGKLARISFDNVFRYK